jgi:hypothetical protein
MIAITAFCTAAPPVHGEGLDLSTGTAVVSGSDQITLENFTFNNARYNAVIRLNLDGTFSASNVELVNTDDETATYEVTFTATWSADTHPTDFPGGSAHFSSLIGLAHGSDTVVWAMGETASAGMESMAETGATSTLSREMLRLESGATLLSGGNIPSSPGSTSFEFQIDKNHSLVTLVSMIAPSPDWFVGVSGLSLLENGEWVEELTVPLHAYDAGTDSGTNYTSANSDTMPRENISKLEGVPFLVNGDLPSLGEFRFRRLN